jgi:hypothetical protein
MKHDDSLDDLQQIETRATSNKTSVGPVIELRIKDQVRLAFKTQFVDNDHDARARINGEFIYEKKRKRDEWLPLTDGSLKQLELGAQYKLALHSDELLKLVKALGRLYQLVWTEGVPKGRKRYVLAEEEAGIFWQAFNRLTETERKELFESNSELASGVLFTLLKWVMNSPTRNTTLEKLAHASIDQLPDVSIVLGMSAVKEALVFWRDNQTNDDEGIWQNALSQRAFVLSQLFPFPVILIGEKVYVGGKLINNTGGGILDFLVKAESTHSTVLIEIKTPGTPLLGSIYREGYPFSHEVSGAITQVLRYRQKLMMHWDSVMSGELRVIVGEPRCLVIVGNSNELNGKEKKNSFDLQRSRIEGVTVITFDEMFDRLSNLMIVFEKAGRESL